MRGETLMVATVALMCAVACGEGADEQTAIADNGDVVTITNTTLAKIPPAMITNITLAKIPASAAELGCQRSDDGSLMCRQPLNLLDEQARRDWSCSANADLDGWLCVRKIAPKAP
ncbi:MAG: hypothetical protein KC503_05820 [Myxococcales bacterium]|nr:hypothetical protein [Myxococcales bacterium]